jgi:hypothetical protein
MDTQFRRNIFIDSASNSIGQTGAVRVVLQPSAFSIQADEQMAVTLRTFEMRYSFYSINFNNNALAFFSPAAVTYTPILIPEGSYTTFALLIVAIQAGFVTAGFVGTTVTYNDQTRFISINLLGAADPAGFLVSFLVKGGTQPAGITDAEFFNDSNEIYGCQQITNFNSPLDNIPAFGAGPVGNATYTSLWPASLTSIEAIYVRLLNLPTNNVSTIGYDFDNPNLTGTIFTNVIARIPLDLAVFDPQHPFITYVEQGNSNFIVYLQQKSLDNLVIVLTDPNGRTIPQVSPNQFTSGHLNYTMCLSWEIIREAPVATRITSGDLTRRMEQIRM